MSQDLSKLTKQELIDRLNSQNQPTESNYEDEMNKLSKMADATNPHQLPYSIKNDHKNIMLYTDINKRVGPLHPENAKYTMQRWRRAGFRLYTTPRTDAQIEAFKKTPEYIKSHEKHLALRKQRRASSSKGKADKMIVDVARETAKAVAAVK